MAVKIQGILIAVLLLCAQAVQAQRYHEEGLLARNGMSEKLIYEVHYNNGAPKDSVLVKKQVFNQKGRIVSDIPIKITGVSTFENYQYSQDTILESIEYFSAKDGVFLNSFQIKYDHKKRIREEIGFNAEGRPAGYSTKNIYNERRQLVEQHCIDWGKVTSRTQYFYSPEGQVIKNVFHFSDGRITTLEKEYEYDDKDNPVVEYQIRDGLKQLVKEMQYNEKSQLVRTSYFYKDRLTQYLSIQKPGLLQEGDWVENMHTYYDNGLLESQSEYVNGEIRLTIFYRYFQ
jgi:hypothetical protein